MELNFDANATKQDVINQIDVYLGSQNLKVASIDDQRPWGGFFVIDQSSTDDFIRTYFPETDISDIKKYGDNISPKILVVQPGQKLSWQYHNHRAELWRIAAGQVGVISGPTDIQGKVVVANPGDILQYGPQTRHRLVGLDKWGIVAEIWQHTDPDNPSNEDDIIRVEDSYGR